MWQGLEPILILAMTLVMEASTVPQMERVYTVVSNRAYHAERTRSVDAMVRQVIKPGQFSCWNESNQERIERAKRETYALTIALRLIEREPIRPEVGQARWYLSHRLYYSNQCPKWALGRRVKVEYDEGSDGHVYLSGVD